MKNLRISIILSLLIIVLSCPAFSQSKPNSFYLELLGNGGLYSVNYDRLFTENLGGRIGVSYLSSFDFIFTSVENLLLVPIMLNYFVGNNHKLELGAGVVIVSADNIGFFGLESGSVGTAIGGTATIGYRYQPSNGGFLFRIGFSPFFADDGFAASGGISLGFSF